MYLIVHFSCLYSFIFHKTLLKHYRQLISQSVVSSLFVFFHLNLRLQITFLRLKILPVQLKHSLSTFKIPVKVGLSPSKLWKSLITRFTIQRSKLSRAIFCFFLGLFSSTKLFLLQVSMLLPSQFYTLCSKTMHILLLWFALVLFLIWHTRCGRFSSLECEQVFW